MIVIDWSTLFNIGDQQHRTTSRLWYLHSHGSFLDGNQAAYGDHAQLLWTVRGPLKRVWHATKSAWHAGVVWGISPMPLMHVMVDDMRNLMICAKARPAQMIFITTSIIEVFFKVLLCKEESLLLVHSRQYKLPWNIHPSESLQRRTVQREIIQ